MISQKKYGTILGFAYTALQAILGIIYIPILLNGIGKAEYGIYQVVGSIISYFAAMESPLCASILKFYVEYKAKGDAQGMENVLAIGQKIFLFFSVFIIVISIPCYYLIGSAFSESFSESELFETRIMFILMIINLIINMNAYVYIAAINAHERFVFLKITALVALVIQPLVVVLVITRFKYAFVMVVIQLALTTVMTLVRYLYAIKTLNTRIEYHYKDKLLYRGIAKLALSTFFVAIADQIFWKTDQLILGSMCGPEVAAEYSIGAQFNTMYISVACVLGGVLLPTITKIMVDGDNTVLSSYFAKIGRYQSYLVSLMLIGFISFGQEAINIIAGDGYEISYMVAILLMIPYSIDLIQTCGGTILTAKNRFEYRAWALFIASIVNVVITILLVKWIGPIGAALSTTICVLLSSGLVMNIIYSKKIGLNLVLFFKRVLPIWGVALVMLPTSYFFINNITLNNVYLQFVLHCLIFLAIYSLLMVSVMNKEEKEVVFGGFLKLIKTKHNL